MRIPLVFKTAVVPLAMVVVLLVYFHWFDPYWKLAGRSLQPVHLHLPNAAKSTAIGFSSPRHLVSDTHRVSLINSSVQQDNVIVDRLANVLKEAREKANSTVTRLSLNADIVARGKVRL